MSLRGRSLSRDPSEPGVDPCLLPAKYSFQNFESIPLSLNPKFSLKSQHLYVCHPKFFSLILLFSYHNTSWIRTNQSFPLLEE